MTSTEEPIVSRSNMAFTEEPIVSRLDRLDLVLKQLEDMKGCNRSPRSSYESTTPSSGAITASDGATSSVNSSPRSLEKHCRPIEAVVMETEVKGNVIERLVQVEVRLLRLCKQLELEENRDMIQKNKHRKRGLKQLVRSCVKGKPKSKHH